MTTAPYPIEETTIAALHAAYVSGRARAALVCQSHLYRIAAYENAFRIFGTICAAANEWISLNPPKVTTATCIGVRH